jgi:hypothetical protein
MAATPEAKVKAEVKKLLARYSVYGHWPVPGGYGAQTLDFLGCINGIFFAIETKAPGQKPTPRQQLTIEAIIKSNGIVFVIDGRPEHMVALKAFLDMAGRVTFAVTHEPDDTAEKAPAA